MNTCIEVLMQLYFYIFAYTTALPDRTKHRSGESQVRHWNMYSIVQEYFFGKASMQKGILLVEISPRWLTYIYKYVYFIFCLWTGYCTEKGLM